MRRAPVEQRALPASRHGAAPPADRAAAPNAERRSHGDARCAIRHAPCGAQRRRRRCASARRARIAAEQHGGALRPREPSAPQGHASRPPIAAAHRRHHALHGRRENAGGSPPLRTGTRPKRHASPRCGPPRAAESRRPAARELASRVRGLMRGPRTVPKQT
ncbi:hypothetical protein BP354E_2973 [Burkholderia pseudomallei 354e]|nr:hypothetical protein BP354E_2973 [Burkholderia pseudomallei 354e]EIF79021.1 hypothetical protein BP354A_3753 [Burkholderia pseudomallei 354a]